MVEWLGKGEGESREGEGWVPCRREEGGGCCGVSIRESGGSTVVHFGKGVGESGNGSGVSDM